MPQQRSFQRIQKLLLLQMFVRNRRTILGVDNLLNHFRRQCYQQNLQRPNNNLPLRIALAIIIQNIEQFLRAFSQLVVRVLLVAHEVVGIHVDVVPDRFLGAYDERGDEVALSEVFRPIGDFGEQAGEDGAIDVYVLDEFEIGECLLLGREWELKLSGVGFPMQSRQFSLAHFLTPSPRPEL